MQFVVSDTRGFRKKQHLTARAETRQQHNGEKDNAETAHPLRETTPKENAVGKRFNVVKNGRAGSRETRHGFKKSICHRGNITTQQKRKHSKEREENPRQRNHYIGFCAIGVYHTFVSVKQQRNSDQKADTE